MDFASVLSIHGMFGRIQMIGEDVVKLRIAFWVFAVLRADVSIVQPDLRRHLHNYTTRVDRYWES
jgi:hypothetical protein